MSRKFLKSVLLATAMMCGVAIAPPVQAAPPAIAFGELPVSFDADISPDGKRIAIIMNVDGTYMVSTTSTESVGADMTLVSLGEELQPEYVRWVNNDRYVVSVSKLENYRDTPFTTGSLFTKSVTDGKNCLLYTSPSPRDKRQSRMPSSA